MRNEDHVPDRFRRHFCRRWQAEAAAVDGQLDHARDAADADARGAMDAPSPPTVVRLSAMALPDDQSVLPGAGGRADFLRPAGGVWVVNLTHRVRFWCPEWIASGYVGASRLIFPDEEFALMGVDGVAREVSAHPLAPSRMENQNWQADEASVREISSEVRIDFAEDGEDVWRSDEDEGEGFLESP